MTSHCPFPGTVTSSLCQEDVAGSGVMPLKVVAWLLPAAFCGSCCWAASPSAHDLGQCLPRWHTFRCPTDVSMSQAAIQGDPFLLARSKATQGRLKLSSWARESSYSTDFLGILVLTPACALTLRPDDSSASGDVLCSFRTVYTLYDGARAQTSRTGPEGEVQLPGSIELRF